MSLLLKEITACITKTHMQCLEVIRNLCPEGKESYLPRTILSFFPHCFFFNALPASVLPDFTNIAPVYCSTTSYQWPSPTNSNSRIYHTYSTTNILSQLCNTADMKCFNRLLSGLLELRLLLMLSILHIVASVLSLKHISMHEMSFYRLHLAGNRELSKVIKPISM